MAEKAARAAEGNRERADDVVDVLLEWRDAQTSSVIGVRRLRRGGVLAVGERGDLVVPLADRADLVRHTGREATVFVPEGAELRVDGVVRDARVWTLSHGTTVEVRIGACHVHLTRGPAGARFAVPMFASLCDSGAGYLAGSAMFHAAIFTAVALFASSLGATEEGPLGPDRLALIQRLLDAGAARDTGAGSGQRPSGAGGSAPPRGDDIRQELSPGTPLSRTHARRREGGETTPEDGQRELAEAARFGLVGMLAGGARTPAGSNAWDSSTTRDELVARTFGGWIGDGMGWGHGSGEGSGGRASVLPLDGFALGQGRRCAGPGPCDGVGSGRGRLGGGHRPAFIGWPRLRCGGGVSGCGDVQVSGRLPPEIVQRVVRQNEGRFRACYEDGLRTNPALAGRITVRFAIDRTGAVPVATDDGGSDLPDGEVRRCVISAFTQLSFPAPEVGVVTVVYPIVFSPE
jgi:hypothetical protein